MSLKYLSTKCWVHCVVYSRWKAADSKMLEKADKRYKFFLKGCRDGLAGMVPYWLTAKWTDKVKDVRISLSLSVLTAIFQVNRS